MYFFSLSAASVVLLLASAATAVPANHNPALHKRQNAPEPAGQAQTQAPQQSGGGASVIPPEDQAVLQRYLSAGAATLPPLPFSYEALMPYIGKRIMELHYSKHHKSFVDNFNKGMIQLFTAIATNDNAGIVNAMSVLKFNGGGHINHSLFWKILSPNVSKGGRGGIEPTGPLANMITQQWGSIQNFVFKFNNITFAIQGSGWGWLAYNKAAKQLEIVTTPNQDTLRSVNPDLCPILGIDVWEHAYYLMYKNMRADYLAAIWNVISWDAVMQLLQSC